MSIAEAIWVAWWGIAEEHAVEARKQVDEADLDVAPGERDPSMVALVASASAIEGLALAVRSRTAVEAPKFAPGTATEKRALEILKRGFDVGKLSSGWLPELQWLFKIRDPLVHHDSDFRPEVRHPKNASLLVSAETLLYSADSAERAVRLVREIASACFGNCRKWEDPRSRQWFEAFGGIVRQRLANPFS